MKTITITTSRQRVFDRVARQMDWQGTRSAEGTESYERVSLSESDSALLHSFFDEAAMHAIDLCRPFLQSVKNTDDSLTLSIALSDHSDESVRESLNPIMYNLLSVHVLRQWLEIVDPARVEGCAGKLREADSRLLSALYHHPAPVRAISN